MVVCYCVCFIIIIIITIIVVVVVLGIIVVIVIVIVIIIARLGLNGPRVLSSPAITSLSRTRYRQLTTCVRTARSTSRLQ